MKPKIVSVKQLQVRELAPPSQEEFVFLEMHGQMGVGEKKQTPVQVQVAPIAAPKKGFLGWLKGIFGK